jgi:1-acyl-sn-glycerol-3-phosphate acyltransferase
MDLAPHLWTVLQLTDLVVEVEFHSPVRLDQFPSRKELSQHCWEVITSGMERSLTGRHDVQATAEVSLPSDGHLEELGGDGI